MSAELGRKLGYRGGPGLVVGAPADYELGFAEDGSKEGPAAFVQVFVRSMEDLRRTVWPLLGEAADDRVFWVCYPKRASGVPSDLHRDVVATTVSAETEFRVVSNVSIDDTWSALRLRPKALVRARG